MHYCEGQPVVIRTVNTGEDWLVVTYSDDHSEFYTFAHLATLIEKAREVDLNAEYLACFKALLGRLSKATPDQIDLIIARLQD